MSDMTRINTKLLEDWKVLKKLELLDIIFNDITEAFTKGGVGNMYFGRFYSLKAQIEAATTVEQIKILEIK